MSKWGFTYMGCDSVWLQWVDCNIVTRGVSVELRGVGMAVTGFNSCGAGGRSVAGCAVTELVRVVLSNVL